MSNNPVYRVFWDDHAGVAVTEWAPGSVCSLDEAQAVTTEVKALGRGPVPILVDMRGMTALERPAREHFLSDQGGVAAIALLAGSAVNRMIANFFIGLRRMPVPIRSFTSQDEAVSWLKEHR